MKELHGEASAEVDAPQERCLALLAEVEGYPSWYPDVVRRVKAQERDADGAVTQAQTTLHVTGVPLISDIEMLLAVGVEQQDVVKLTRIPHDERDHEKFVVTWRLAPSGTGTQLSVSLDANLSVPRLVPVGGIGNNLAKGFVSAAARALGAPQGS